MNNILVTGSNGLIGEEVVSYFASEEYSVCDVDNNMETKYINTGGNKISCMSDIYNLNYHFNDTDIANAIFEKGR